MAELVLGLDLGPTSIGWSLIDEQGERIVAAGVRVFPEGVDRDTSGGEVSKNVQRRIARGTRRQIARRARRKAQLRHLLVQHGLLPASAEFERYHPERVAWEDEQFRAADPYTLRRRALTEPLNAHEIGRVLLHLTQRRGFKSNRKADRSRRKETSEMLQEISQLAADMKGRTLGEHLTDLRGDDPRKFHLTRLRGRHTLRDMYLDEFERIWTAQQKHHPALLTDELKANLRDRIIFFQRELYWSASVIGHCELAPRHARCPRADRRAQRFRLLQEVNNLRVIDANGERPLTADERQTLIDYLSGAKERTFDQIRKKLFEQHDGLRFNFERGERTKLDGMVSDAILSHKDVLGKKGWAALDEDQRNRLVTAMIDGEEPRIRHVASALGLPESMAEQLADVDLPSGYSSYGLHAIKRLLPYLERWLPLTSADPDVPCALREAGYVLPWEHVPNQQKYLPEPPELTNPLVHAALHEVRKVINSVLRELVYRPEHKLSSIRIELAREVRGTAKQRALQTRRLRDREAMRNHAADAVRTICRPTRDAIDRYLLWQEQNHECVYSGRPISLAQLLSSEVDVDHILPYPRSLDNSLANRVVCFRSENAAKADKTPYEWLAHTNPGKWDQVIQRSRKLADTGKYRRFLRESVELDDFFARQFVDTTYIASQVRQYVLCLGADVVCTKGQHTSDLRHHWGLDAILDTQGLNLKNREDHRHHAVDAVVVALTNRQRLQTLANIRRTGGTRVTGEVVPEPWDHFFEQTRDLINAIHVSHRPRRKVAGPLHEESIYGSTDKPKVFVKRKPIASLSPTEIDKIRDPAIKQIVISRLSHCGIEFGRGKTVERKKWIEAMNDVKMPSGVPVKKVRLLVPEESVRPIRGGSAWVKPGSLHHAAIFEITDDKGRPRRDAVYITMIEAKRRVRNREAIIQRTHPDHPLARFLFSVSTGDLLLAEWDGQEKLVLVSTLVSTQKRIHIVDARDARPSATKQDVGKSANSLVARKVIVDPIGRVRWAND